MRVLDNLLRPREGLGEQVGRPPPDAAGHHDRTHLVNPQVFALHVEPVVQAGRVCELEFEAAKVGCALYRVSRHAGLVVDKRQLLAWNILKSQLSKLLHMKFARDLTFVNSVPQRRLKSEDLPTLGRPITATRKALAHPGAMLARAPPPAAPRCDHVQFGSATAARDTQTAACCSR